MSTAKLKRRWFQHPIVLLLAAVVLLVLVGSGVYYRHTYPFGMSHRCEILLWFALKQYAQEHDGRFPSGEAMPEASLSLLGRKHAYLLPRRDIDASIVEQVLERGQLLGPENCGWHYVEGLRLDSNPQLALFWDKEGLDEMGGRLPAGGHMVCYIGMPGNYVPESQWSQFLEEQDRLLVEEKARTKK